MKLRNKNTGEIARRIDISANGEIIWVFDELHPIKYERLKDLIEDWEDYEPIDPLIKDEKIRKAVRAWAGCNLLDGDDRVFLSKPTFDCKILSLEHGMLNFDVYYDDESLCNKEYTIAELCGKEEE